MSVGTITYIGTLIEGGYVSTSPWTLAGAVIPDHGGVPYVPQFALEILQPDNVDGARHRAGGMHFPVFTLNAIVSAKSYATAHAIAREMEVTKGDRINLEMTADGGTYKCMVIDCKARANAKRVVGASTNYLVSDSASVDAVFQLQVVGE